MAAVVDAVVSLTREGALGLVTLNRPPANSYNLAFVQDLAAAVDAVRRDDAIRVVILQSALRFFSAGADVKAFHESSYDANMELINAEHRVLEQIEQTPKLFIAMIAGHCLGGGLEIALACDLRFAANGDYKIGVPEVTLGLMPGNGGTQRLPRLIGKSRALDLMISGRTITPSEAQVLGIVDRLMEPGDLERETKAFAGALANGPAVALGSIKLAVNNGMQVPLHEGLAYERALTARLFQSQDASEGIGAFVEKRKPNFQGK